MKHSSLMRMVDRSRDDDEQPSRSVRRPRAPDLRRERPAFNPLHTKECQSVGVPDLIDWNNMRVIEASGRFSFLS